MINTREFFVQVNELEYEVLRLREENKELKERSIDAKQFYASAVTTDTVAALHGVNPDTVRKYVTLGCIEKHPNSTDAKILIRASDALLLNFNELRRKARLGIRNK